jgi:kumamolisin
VCANTTQCKGTYNQVIAVLIDGSPNVNDVNYFLNYNSITTSFPLHYDYVGNGVGNDTLEAMLDVDTVFALAPGAFISLYAMPDLSEQSGEWAFSKVVNDNASGNVAVATASWGECDNISNSYDAALENSASAGNVKGQTFVAGTGDWGVDHCPTGSGIRKGPTMVPASAPNVLGAGGTSPDGEYSDVWGGAAAGQYAWSGTGGGTSSYFAKPGFQSSLGCGMRCLPDLSLPGDPAGGQWIWCGTGAGDCNDGGQVSSGFNLVGGTSLSSPLAAAAIAEMAEYVGAPLGQINDNIYKAYNGAGYSNLRFYDITAGNNGAQAGTRWDFASGIGDPDWFYLVNIF